MSDELSPGDLTAEAVSRLAKLEVSDDCALATAASDLHLLLKEPETISAPPESESPKQMWGVMGLPALAVAANSSSPEQHSLWANVWGKLGLPDPQIFGSISASDLALIFIVIAVAVILLRPWRKIPAFQNQRRQRNALSRLARAAAAAKQPAYQTSVFKCVNDYNLCCRSGTNSKFCLALGTICITKELLSVGASGAK